MRLRKRLGLSDRQQRVANRAMQLALVGFVFVGIYELNAGVALNALIALLVTQLPAVLRRDFDIALDPGLTMWVTGAVFLHALGTLGLPGMERNFYVTIWWWDHLTHALSSSVVAGAGYATARALADHREDLSFPPRFTVAFILLLTVAFGVLWEVLEFLLMEGTVALGLAPVLTQYGVGDTMLDLVFDAMGGVVVAVAGTTTWGDVSETLRERLERV
ncbi:MAG: hypothetical protein ABEJ77_03940 [Halanaeroarchaeum sp.]